MFPLTSVEMEFRRKPFDTLCFGNLPLAVTGNDPEAFLISYAETYLQEEIRAEALTRSIGDFSRFLEIAARQNGQVTNTASISRDAAVSRQTVQNYFDILVDTLAGSWLHPWKLKRSTKQVSHSKFYLFDCGVARALTGRIAYPPTREEQGTLLETFLLGEVKACFSYNGIRYPLFFWRNYNGLEVDLLWENKEGFVAIEIKAAERWDKKFNRGLVRLTEELGEDRVKRYGVYMGERRLMWNGIEIMPVMDFLHRLWQGRPGEI
jgi:predicted AAA+ superfamily ATPase